MMAHKTTCDPHPVVDKSYSCRRKNGDLSPAYAPYAGTPAPATEAKLSHRWYTVRKTLTREGISTRVCQGISASLADARFGIPITGRLVRMVPTGGSCVKLETGWWRQDSHPADSMGYCNDSCQQAVQAKKESTDRIHSRRKASGTRNGGGRPIARIGELRNTRVG